MSFLDFFKGFVVTGKLPFKPKVTTQYPEEKRPKPERFHGRHVLNRYEDGMEKCIGCELCAGVCPARCIYVRGADNPPDAPVSPGERYGFVYEINFLRCIHCDMCVEACPPRPSPSPSCSSGRSSTGKTPSTPRPSCSWTTRAARRSCPGRTGSRATTATPRPGCGPPARPAPAALEGPAAVVRRARLRRAAGPEGAERPGRRRRTGRHRPVVAGDGGRRPEGRRRETAPGRPRPARRRTSEPTCSRPAGQPAPGCWPMRASSGTHLAHASAWTVFIAGAVLILGGAFGVVLLRNPVHCALMLVVTLFGVAFEFVNQAADFLAAVQIIVYAGAIVILFLFVIMFLGVDRREPARCTKPTRFQRPLAAILGVVVALIEILVLSRVSDWSIGPVYVRTRRPAPPRTASPASSAAPATTSRSSGSRSTPATCCPSR